MGVEPSPGAAVEADPATDAADVEVVEDGADPTEDDRPRFVRFAVADRSFLIPVGAVQEVLVAEPCTRLPGSPPAILGVINVRGRIVAIVDPRPLLHPTAPEPDGSAQFLVVTTPTGPVGLRVDRVADVVPAVPDPTDPGDGASAAPSLDVLDSDFVVATVTLADAALAVLDPLALVDTAIGRVEATIP